MTIVCFRKGTMASDGRLVEEGTIFTNNAKKIYRLKSGALLGLAGDADHRDTVQLFNAMKGKKFPTVKKLISLNIDFEAILVYPDGTVYHVACGPKTEEDNSAWFGEILEVKDEFIAIGTGAKFALGALDHGATAEEAVKTAITYDNACGGVVQVFKMEDSL